MMAAQVVYCTLKGYKHKLSAEYRHRDDVVELSPDRAILHWMFGLEKETQIQPLMPENLGRHIWVDFIKMLESANLSRALSYNTTDNLSRQWTLNALTNASSGLLDRAKSVTDIPAPGYGETAVICGNGPSLEDCLSRVEGTLFAAWHCAPRVLVAAAKSPRFVAHIDPFNPQRPGFVKPELPPETSLIVTPTTSPEFIELYKANQAYLYIGHDVWMHSWFANHLNTQEQPHVVGTVAHCMVQTALLAGYKRIVLAGVDLGVAKPDDWDFHNSNDIKDSKNRFGVTVYQDELFRTYSAGFEGLARDNRGVEFINASRTGADIEGWKPL